jgi:hypothetical protein
VSEGVPYRLTLEPAYIEMGDGSLRAKLPGAKEELIEFIIYKLAVESGYFYNADGANKATDNFVLLTSLYKIHQELKKRGKQRAKTKSYSYAQIREALLVLSKTKLHLKSEKGDSDLVFSLISDFGFFNNNSQDDPEGSRATLYIKFNSLISKSILARNWRQMDYETVIEDHNYLSRRLRKLLALKFTYAAPNKSFNINLSTLIENSGISLYDRMSDNLKYVEAVLRGMSDIVERFTIVKSFAVHPETRRGRVLADAKIVIWPTRRFVQSQIETNIHQQNLDEARLDAKGQVRLEPSRRDHDSYKSYDEARQLFDSGKPLDC